MKNILIISYHFYPDTAVGAKRPSELALALKKQGYDVSIITAKTSNFDRSLNKKIDGMNVKRITPPPSLENYIVRSIKKLLGKDSSKKKHPRTTNNNESYKHTPNKESLYRKLRRWYFSWSALIDALKLWSFFLVLTITYRRLFTKKYDLVISSGPPMASHYPALFCKVINNCPWVLDLRDPFPVISFVYPNHTFMSQDVKSKFREKIELLLEKLALIKSDLIITSSPGIQKELQSRYEIDENKYKIIFNGFDEQADLSALNLSTDRITFIYAGTLYFNRNPFPLLNSFKKLITSYDLNPKDISLNFYGHCDSWRNQSLHDWISENEMQSYVLIHPPVDKDTIIKKMSAANVLVNLSQGQARQIPAKTFDYIGMRKSILTIAEHDSASGELLKNITLNTTIDPEIDDFSEDLYEIYKQQKNNLADYTQDISKYSRIEQNKFYLKQIEQLL